MAGFNKHSDIDSGWAWLVLVGVSFGVLIYCCTMYMGGIVYVSLLKMFREDYTKTALVGSVNVGLMCFAAPPAGIAINKYNSRVVIIAGGLLSGVGFAASAFAESVDSVIATAGGLVGLGYSCSSAGLCVALGFYFRKWRNHAISLYYVIVAIAIFMTSPFGNHIIDEYGIRSAFLIMGSLNLQICVIGVICKPSSIEKEIHIERELSLQKEKRNRAKIIREKNTTTKILFNISLLRNIPFVCFLVSTASWNFALTVAIMHLPNYVSVNKGDAGQINQIMTLFSVGHLVGRIIGCLSVSLKENISIYVHLISLGLGGAVTAAFPLYSQHSAGNSVFSILLGLSCGAPSAMATVLATMFVGVAMLPEAYSLVYVFGGIGVTTGPVIAGQLYSSYGTYVFSFVTAGCVLLLGSVSSIMSVIIQSQTKADDSKINTKETEICVKQEEVKETLNQGTQNNCEISTLLNDI